MAHKRTLTDALIRANADRLTICDVSVGRKGLLGYLKAIGGVNVVKIVPLNGGAGESQADGKKLKVVCGNQTGIIADGDWIGDKTPMAYAEVRVSPKHTVHPNFGSGELAEALAQVLPFITVEDNRPVLGCVSIEAGEGKLTMVTANGFVLAVKSLDYDEGEGRTLIKASELKSALIAIRRAQRVKLAIENNGFKGLSLDTELIRYKFQAEDGTFPAWSKLIPEGGEHLAHFDTIEALKAVSSLKALADEKEYMIDLNIGDGLLTLTTVDGDGKVDISADTDGDPVAVRLNGGYLTAVLRAVSGMVDMRVKSPADPVDFTAVDFRVIVMPVMVSDKKDTANTTATATATTTTPEKPDTEAEGEPETEAEEKPETETETPPEQPEKPKRTRKAKGSRKPELAAVA